MRYYIADDDISMVRILTNIIEEDNSFEVIGCSNNGETAYNEILLLSPDIVLVDFLMPKMDGNTLVQQLKILKPDICFIMISQVLDSELIADSYKSGIEFFINKPINKIEVEKVISKVAEKIEMKMMLSNIKKMLKSSEQPNVDIKDSLKEVKHVLSILGMLGEKGTTDIIKICTLIIETKKSFSESNLEELFTCFGDTPEIVKQRIRRSIKNGLENMANLGIEDYMNETFNTYANVLFDFSSVKAEMDHIKGKKNTGGKISINKFFEGLLLYCEIG
ncbi:DNA-binding domain-containing protein [Clostridium tagluense]|uniref:DNA-binding domain-containing protein n=1 Tax=Clostridium tagluense TaxID=360422 RepID=UPI001CF36999|nr:DNA-binding domain-containing protein [Clostridium tagluense]MCB2300466.1 response regulator [Clostridium tagluense]